ncbi:DUF2231 domain-containing protein [Citrifermentans bremense]|uniref:DUF2231 domain-containing protein n=1 Tax=Citrifermentans bremense TaxID=60035 RepID=A0A6S6M0R8_9BACT|nr:DUF2231 domain-containing protein [Citrifermentans bremense]
MISKASVAKHPIHPMLVPLPIGLWIFSLVCDLIYEGSGDLLWHNMAHYSLAGGVIGGLLAALPEQEATGVTRVRPRVSTPRAGQNRSP